MTVADALDQARDYSEAFYSEHLPAHLCVRQLQSIEQQYAQRIALDAPEALTDTETFAEEEIQYGRTEGIALTPSLLPGSITAELEDGEQKEVWLVGESEALEVNMPGHLLRAFRRGEMLYPVGADWARVVLLKHSHVPAPKKLIGLAQKLALPEYAMPAVIARLALGMASRRGVLKELPHLPQEVETAETTLFAVLSAQSGTTHHRVRQVR
jgi:hypothetical protein